MPVTGGARLEWTGTGLVFTGTGTHPGSPPTTIDANGTSAPSPVHFLLLAAASCAATDVVLILQKMRVNLTALQVEVSGERRDEQPRRFLSMKLVFVATAADLDLERLERAVDLSVHKYCSVMATLDPDLDVQIESRLA